MPGPAGWMHLVRRFVSDVVPIPPSEASNAWVAEVLSEPQQSLWRRMRAADRRHSVRVARRVHVALGDDATGPVLAAALLHDVGKVDSRLGTYGRVVATICGRMASHATIDDWRRGRGFVRRVALYLQHPRLGSEMLALAGSDQLTVTWAAEHHLPPEESSLPLAVAAELAAADGD